MANGTDETRDLWKELTELKTLVKSIPDKINYYTLINLQNHKENCFASSKIYDVDNRLKKIEEENQEKKDKKKWYQKETFKSVVTVIIAILTSFIIFKLGFK